MGGAHATVALLLALEYRDRTGRGMFLECPMVGSSLNLAAEQIVEHSAYGRLLERRGNRSATCVPQGVYRTADTEPDGRRDRWVAISVADDEQWIALADIDAHAGVAIRSRASPTVDGRRAVEDELDATIAEWCAVTRDAGDRRRAVRRRAFPPSRSCPRTSTTGRSRWCGVASSKRSSIR